MINDEYLKAANELGQTLKFTANGIGMSEANAIRGFVNAIETSPEKRAMEKAAATMAECVMRESGNMSKFSYHLARAIDEYTGIPWPEHFSEFADVAIRAIGRVSMAEKQASEIDGEDLSDQETKSAMAKWLLNMTGRGAALTPDVIHAMLGMSAGAGAALGGIGWRLNRDTQQDADDLEAMKAKIDTYDRISNEIESEMQDRARAKPADKHKPTYSRY